MAHTVKIMTANIATSMLGLSDILKRDKPELLFLQEVNISTDNVNDIVSRLGYSVECNVDPLHPTRGGKRGGSREETSQKVSNFGRKFWGKSYA